MSGVPSDTMQQANEFKRNRWDQPLIVPPGGGKPVAYRRASKYAKVVDDDTMLTRWKIRVATLGLMADNGLQTEVLDVLNTFDDPLDDPDAKKRMNALIDRAHEVGGGNKAAALGTWWHTLSEYVDQQEPLPDEATDQEHARMGEYAEELAAKGVSVLDIEQPVVNDTYKAAGTFDRLVSHEGCIRVLDLKTGSHDPVYPMGVAGQLAIYDGAVRYDPATDERSELHPDMDHEWGLLAHLPAKGEGCRLYKINLEIGRAICDEAQRVYEVRKFRARDICVPL